MHIDRVMDPVCHMEFDKEDAADECTFEGKTYYFCAAECKEMFEEWPEEYTEPEEASA